MLVGTYIRTTTHMPTLSTVSSRALTTALITLTALTTARVRLPWNEPSSSNLSYILFVFLLLHRGVQGERDQRNPPRGLQVCETCSQVL